MAASIGAGKHLKGKAVSGYFSLPAVIWGLQRCVPLALQRKVQPLPGPWGLRGGCKVCLGAGVSLVVRVPWCLSLSGARPLHHPSVLGTGARDTHPPWVLLMVHGPCTVPWCLSQASSAR